MIVFWIFFSKYLLFLFVIVFSIDFNVDSESEKTVTLYFN